MGPEGVRETNDLMVEADLQGDAPIYVVGFVSGAGRDSRRLLGFLGALEKRYTGTVRVRAMRGDEHPAFLRRLGIGPLPALAIWRKGLFFARWFGVIDPSAVRRVVGMLSDTPEEGPRQP